MTSENFQKEVVICLIIKTKYSDQKKKSFNHGKHKHDTKLSNEIWKIKASKEKPVIVCKILGQYQPYSVNTKHCLLCLVEKATNRYL